MLKKWNVTKEDIISETHFSQKGKDLNLQVKYHLEYTEKDEFVNKDYSNLIEVKRIVDLEHLTESLFKLREAERYSISIGYTIEDAAGNWLIEDYCHNIEEYINTRQERQARERITELKKTMEMQQKEIDIYKQFLEKYNAKKEFEKFRENLLKSL